MYTITKQLKGYPFAHRQPSHDGHCALVHGHNWDFEITLGATELDENGFIYDFGKLEWLKTWLEQMFDHTLVLNEDDPQLGYLQLHLERPGLADIKTIPSCSCEGIAEYVFKHLTKEFEEKTNGRVSVVRVTVFEDYKNSATYYE